MNNALIHALLVGAGGFLGALLRYGLTGLVHRQFTVATFPHGTLAVNLLGCFMIGAFAGVAESRQVLGSEVRTFVLIGLLGGFTTFSALGLDTFAMIRGDNHLGAALNVAVHLIAGLALVWLGYELTSG